ncbi:MAG: hypothetical protein FJY56_21560, partial [Betaproteobacteria bacterium]|nr:hypothetical protein [Betaproteobacteria bacterium]
MRLMKFLLSVGLLAGAGAAFADPPATVGRLSFLSGTVSFASADTQNEWGVAPLNRPITTGDRLWADRDGRAEIRIGPNAIRMAAMTSLDMLRLDDDVTQLRLAQGTLNLRVRELESGDSFEISTPRGAVLLSRPGSYRVSVDADGLTAVLTRHGEADVLSSSGTPLTVRENQLASFSAHGQDLYSAPAPDEFDQWALARKRGEERLVATRYVSPAMTGHEDLDQHGAWHSAPEYGNVWVPSAVPLGWAPYRYGRWLWVSPWGWTWVDNAPWGFAPYHYGRWVYWGNRWAWAPGPRVARPVYAPALVAFVGGWNWSVSVASGPAVAWVPLGWREPYIPWYRHSPTYVRNVNITHVTNINVFHQYNNVRNVTHVRHVNRDVPSATTVVARDTFVRARQVHQARLDVPAHALAHARATYEAPVARPERQSVMPSPAHARLPAAVQAREVWSMRAPGERPADGEQRPRVRVLETRASDAMRGAAEPDAEQARPAADVAAAQPRATAGAPRGTTDDAPRTPRFAAPPGERARATEPAAQNPHRAAETQATEDARAARAARAAAEDQRAAQASRAARTAEESRAARA